MGKVKTFFQGLLGKWYPVAVDALDRTVASFLVAALGLFTASATDIPHLKSIAFWQAVLGAGIIAAVNTIKSAILIAITGQPALGGLFSRTLRARREQPVVRHKVPVAKPKPRRKPPTYHGEHEEKP